MNQRPLGKYQLKELLERGAGGETWKAFDTLHHRSVAVKIVEVNPETGSEFFASFNQEGPAIAALRHPNIVQVQEFFLEQEQSEAFIVTDYVEGQSLADYLKATAHIGNLSSPTEIIHLLMPIAAALDYAHRQRVLHGALKPSVILLDKRRGIPPSPGQPMLVSFGMRQRQDPRLLPLNKVSYVAPEVAQGYGSTRRSDLYSLGVILYELCTGTLPFQGETPSDVLMQHIHNTPLSPVLINPHIRPALAGVIMRGLARDPAARFSSATALVSAAAKAMNISVPEGMGQSDAAITPSFSGSDSLTYIVPPPSSLTSSQSGPFPPTVAGSNAPTLPPSPVVPSVTPTLPVTPSGDISQIQSPVNVTPPSSPQISGPHPLVGKPMPVVTPIPPSSRQTQLSLASLPAFFASTRKGRVTGFTVLAVLLLIVLLGSGVLLYLRATQPSSQTTLVGHAFFVSSGLISTESNQGITDGLRVSLQNIQNPQPGKSYYGWLTSSSALDVPPLALGPLTVDHGQISMSYNSPQHDNLLAHYNHFLITEEDANQQPTNPTLDESMWPYSAAFSTVRNPTDPKHFSLFDHLRHLLSQDPKLAGVGLSGGLGEWLYRNTSKILEAAGSARDSEQGCIGSTDEACAGLIFRQVARILDYLDGSAYVQTENIPTSIQGDQLLIDPTIARVALLEFDPMQQEPPGYLKHIGTHLQEISQISGASSDQRMLANHITQDINNVQVWLDAVHKDASELIHMSTAQLLQAETLPTLNDLFNQANTAFVGQIDPNTNNVKEGVVQIYYHIQALATFDVVHCSVNNGQSSCGGN